MPVRNERSATRAERLAERIAEKVATAKISVPPAVANDEIVCQSVTAAGYSAGQPTYAERTRLQGRQHVTPSLAQCQCGVEARNRRYGAAGALDQLVILGVVMSRRSVPILSRFRERGLS